MPHTGGPSPSLGAPSQPRVSAPSNRFTSHGDVMFARVNFAFAATLAAAATLPAQNPQAKQPQTVDYKKADIIRNAGKYVLGTTVAPRLLEDSVRFYYRSTERATQGIYYVVDPARGSRRVLFDNAKLA